MANKWHLSIRVLHWLMATLFLVLLALGLYMVELDYYDPNYRVLPDYHKQIGIGFSLLLVIRMMCRLLTDRPALSIPALFKRMSLVSHILIYLLLITMIVSGYLLATADGRPIILISFLELPSPALPIDDLGEVAGEVHEWASWCLVAVLVCHSLAALYHHFVLKDDVLSSMIPKAGDGSRSKKLKTRG